MSQKRKHTDGAEDAAAPKPFKKQRSFKPGDGQHKPKGKRPHLSHDDDNTRSINALKSRIRDLKRLLAHIENVPKHKMSAGARQERERELEACEHEVAEKQRMNHEDAYRQKMIGRYHQVRFFDRQKATRILKRLKKEHASTEDTEERTTLRQRIHTAEVDVNYAIYYPLMKPYSSLYPKSKNKKSDDSEGADDDEDNVKSKGGEIEGPKGDVEMWKAIEQAMEDGTLDRLRHSKDSIPAEPPKKSKKPKVKESKPHTTPKVAGHNGYTEHDVDDDSDGGFFE